MGKCICADVIASGKWSQYLAALRAKLYLLLLLRVSRFSKMVLVMVLLDLASEELEQWKCFLFLFY